MSMQGQQFYWTGTYSFKPEIKYFLEGIKTQIEEVLNKIERAEKAIEQN